MLYFILWVVFLALVVCSVPIAMMLEKRGQEPEEEIAMDDESSSDFDGENESFDGEAVEAAEVDNAEFGGGDAFADDADFKAFS